MRPTYEKENIKIIFVLYYFYGFSIFDKCVQIMLKLWRNHERNSKLLWMTDFIVFCWKKNYQVTNIQKTFDTNADSPHQTGNILKPGRDNLAFTILMMAQIVLNWEINLRNIIRKRAVEHDQFNIKRINNIVDCNWNIFGSLSEKNDIKNNNTPINNLFDFSYLW